ncbi:four helix bundle protein [Okeania sp.]|uniref:four helix bundle protein n=1 Tax=Okeania sp. TaxID=3100323 RepID=UPI002B4ACE5B|nr:four helix bundle protein [Okeania sp.]MEB3339182.1 four helix bundle protein [Okeania sp.]
MIFIPAGFWILPLPLILFQQTLYTKSKKFPIEERYSLIDQIRRSSRSVCANLAGAWRKRRYELAFVAKFNDCEAEAAETQTWLDFAVKC